jgi:hypothetical protein
MTGGDYEKERIVVKGQEKKRSRWEESGTLPKQFHFFAVFFRYTL